jgi:hypothetical protein
VRGTKEYEAGSEKWNHESPNVTFDRNRIEQKETKQTKKGVREFEVSAMTTDGDCPLRPSRPSFPSVPNLLSLLQIRVIREIRGSSFFFVRVTFSGFPACAARRRP